MQTFWACVQALPSNVTFTGFSVADDVISIEGTAKTTNDLQQFATGLSNHKNLADYQWSKKASPASPGIKNRKIKFEFTARLPAEEEDHGDD